MDARMNGRTDNVKTVYPPQTKFAGGILRATGFGVWTLCVNLTSTRGTNSIWSYGKQVHQKHVHVMPFLTATNVRWLHFFEYSGSLAYIKILPEANLAHIFTESDFIAPIILQWGQNKCKIPQGIHFRENTTLAQCWNHSVVYWYMYK